MRKFRFQFTLRTVFITSFIFAIFCSLWKCEIDARSNFSSAVIAIDKSLRKINSEFNAEHHSIGSEETDGHFVDPNGRYVLRLFVESTENSTGYFGSNMIIRVKSFHYITISYWGDNNVIKIAIQCSRPCSIISRQTSIVLIVNPATQNDLLLPRLKAELDRAGLKYEVKEVTD